MIAQTYTTLSINSVTPSVTCVSALACVARLIAQKLLQCTVIGQPQAEVMRSLLSAISLRGRCRGICVKAFTSQVLSWLNLCLTLFSGKTPPLITGCCTPLIGRWKRGFGFQGWWPPIHVEPRLLASMELHYNHPESVQKLSF